MTSHIQMCVLLENEGPLPPGPELWIKPCPPVLRARFPPSALSLSYILMEERLALVGSLIVAKEQDQIAALPLAQGILGKLWPAGENVPSFINSGGQWRHRVLPKKGRAHHGAASLASPVPCTRRPQSPQQGPHPSLPPRAALAEPPSANSLASGLRRRPSLRNLLILFDGMPACRAHEPWFSPLGLRRGRQEQRTARRVAQSHGAPPPSRCRPESTVRSGRPRPLSRPPGIQPSRVPGSVSSLPSRPGGHVASSLCVVSTPNLPRDSSAETLIAGSRPTLFPQALALTHHTAMSKQLTF